MENINPKMPVVILAAVKKNEFLKKLSFSNYFTPLIYINTYSETKKIMLFLEV